MALLMRHAYGPSNLYAVFSADDRRVAMHIYANTDVIVKSDGDVEWYSPALLTSTCPQNAALYPLDIQVCSSDYCFGYQELYRSVPISSVTI